MKSIAVLVAAAAFAAVPALAQQLPPSAQERHPIPEQPNTAPMSPAHQQAHQANALGQCGAIVAQARDNIGLRIQQPIPGAETRLSTNAALDAAAGFAAAGDDEGCWHWYDRAQQVLR